MGKGEYDNQTYPSADKGGIPLQPQAASPPPYSNPGYGAPQAVPPQGYGAPQAYPSQAVNYGAPQTQNTTNVIQVQPGLANPAPTNVVVVHQQQQDPLPSMVGHIVFSCVVFWLCNCLFGCIAFFLAIAGLSAETPDKARNLGKASMWVNIAGIILTVVLIVVIVSIALTVGLGYSRSSCYYPYCY